MDAIGGGGWGPVGTTTLLSSGRLEPRKVVGSIDTSEFVVAVGGSLGFLLALGSQGIDCGATPARCSLGGVIAAPIAAWLVSRLAGPRARCRGRWPDRADQLQDHRRGRSARRRRPSALLVCAVVFVLWVLVDRLGAVGARAGATRRSAALRRGRAEEPRRRVAGLTARRAASMVE